MPFTNELGNHDGGPGGLWIWKMSFIYPIHSIEQSNIREIHLHADNVSRRHVGLFQNGADVVERLFHFCLEARRNLACRVLARHARNIESSVDQNSVAPAGVQRGAFRKDHVLVGASIIAAQSESNARLATNDL